MMTRGHLPCAMTAEVSVMAGRQYPVAPPTFISTTFGIAAGGRTPQPNPKDFPMTDIDDQVAAFREQLDTIPTTDDQFLKDVTHLTEAILAAPSYQRATFLVQEFHAARKEDRDYVGMVVVAMVSQVAISACFESSDGYAVLQFVKLNAIAHTARRLGLRAARIIPKVGD